MSRKSIYANMIINAPLCFSSKAAILLLYFDIFTAHGSMRIAIYFGLMLDVLHSLPGLAIASYCLVPHAGQVVGAVLLQHVGSHSLGSCPGISVCCPGPVHLYPTDPSDLEASAPSAQASAGLWYFFVSSDVSPLPVEPNRSKMANTCSEGSSPV